MPRKLPPLKASQRKYKVVQNIESITSFWLRKCSLDERDIERGIVDIIISFHGILPFTFDIFNPSKMTARYKSLPLPSKKSSYPCFNLHPHSEENTRLKKLGGYQGVATTSKGFKSGIISWKIKGISVNHMGYSQAGVITKNDGDLESRNTDHIYIWRKLEQV